jgi:hypothetical protein
MSKDSWAILNNLIEDYSENRESFDLDRLQSLREKISLQLFFLSDSFSEYISTYDQMEHIRKTKSAEREQFWRTQKDEDRKSMTIAEAANRARTETTVEVENCKESLRKKKRAEIVLMSVQQILHAISSRLNIIKDK